jgi:cytochrome P450
MRFLTSRRYGKYVRIGPNDLSIIDPQIMEPGFGLQAKAIKAEWYDGPKPFDSMHTTRDRALHDRRRRTWAPGFSDRALREYEEKVQLFNDKLVQRVREHLGGSINMTKWFNLYSFDVMGQLSFGKDYGMLDHGERHWALDLLVEGMSASPPKPPVWFFRALLNIPGLASGYYKFLSFCKGELKWRVENKAEKDITGWLLKAYEGVPHPEEDPFFQADVRLIIVAGSDTTSACLTFLLYHLAIAPQEVQKLRAELRPLTKGNWSDQDIKNAHHLNGAINESLRMHPPVPSGLERVTVKEGMHVGDTYIPGGVHFWVPMYSIGRGECSIK